MSSGPCCADDALTSAGFAATVVDNCSKPFKNSGAASSSSPRRCTPGRALTASRSDVEPERPVAKMKTILREHKLHEEEDKRSRGERLSEQVAQLLPRHMLTRSNTSTNLNTARKLNASSPPKHSQHSCSSAKAAAKEDSPSFSVRHSAIARYSSSDGENVGRVLDMV